MEYNFVLLSLLIISSSASKYVPQRTVKWANGSFTIFNVAHGPNDYRDLARTYEDMQNLKRAILNNFSSILFAIPTDKKSEGKLTRATDTLHYLLNFHLENVTSSFDHWHNFLEDIFFV